MSELGQFFVLTEKTTFWSLINSPFFVTVVIGGIGIWIKEGVKRDLDVAPDVARAREAVAEKTQEVQQQIDRIANQPEPAHDFRSAARQLVGSVKRKIDQLVEYDPDRRHHRVYERLGRYDYKVRAEALWERGMMYQETLYAVMTALTGWDAYSKGRAAKKAVPKEIFDMLSKADKELNDDVSDFGA